MMRTHTHLTKPTSAKTVQPGWRIVDANAKVLGRVATQAASWLQGKHKAGYVSNLDSGDHVIVVNAAQVVVTGRKGIQKAYTNYSGYPGGLRKEAFDNLVKRRPTEVVRRAISGMLPKNKLRDKRLARLHIYADDKHPYANHFEK